MASASDSDLVTDEFACMGTRIRVLVGRERSAEAFGAVRELFWHWHRTLTRFDAESELSRLNLAAGVPAVVSPLLFEVVARAIDAAIATDGVFDPCLLPQLLAAGYDRTFDELRPDAPAAGVARPGGAWQGLRMDRPSHTIHLPRGAQMDLGGIAKGMAVDASIALLGDRGIEAAAVEAGGDLRVLGNPPDGGAWPVALDDSIIRGEHLVDLSRGALATSTILRRRWRKGMAGPIT